MKRGEMARPRLLTLERLLAKQIELLAIFHHPHAVALLSGLKEEEFRFPKKWSFLRGLLVKSWFHGGPRQAGRNVRRMLHWHPPI